MLIPAFWSHHNVEMSSKVLILFIWQIEMHIKRTTEHPPFHPKPMISQLCCIPFSTMLCTLPLDALLLGELREQRYLKHNLMVMLIVIVLIIWSYTTLLFHFEWNRCIICCCTHFWLFSLSWSLLFRAASILLWAASIEAFLLFRISSFAPWARRRPQRTDSLCGWVMAQACVRFCFLFVLM